MNFSIVVATGKNGEIGSKGKLLWSIPSDLKHFKDITTSGKISMVIMGRKTYESIGKALPDRLNIIISRTIHEDVDDVKWATSLEDAINIANSLKKEIFIIGGGSIYEKALEKDIVDRIYLTRIKKKVYDADTFFPAIDYNNEWKVNKVNSYKEGLIEYDICEIYKR